MKSLAEIIENIKTDVANLEWIRLQTIKKARQTKLLGFLIAALVAMVGLGILLLTSFEYLAIPIMLSAMILIGSFSKAKVTKKEFQLSFKREMVKKIVHAFNPNLIYKPDRIVPQVDYTLSKLFKKEPDRILGEDYLEGQHGDTKFRLSEYNPQYKVKTKNGTKWVSIFKGLFMVADFHKYFHSETYILPETAWKKIGLNKKKYQGADLIKMEDENFEKRFRVFSTNDQDARYILSPVMMDRIAKLQEEFGDDLSISFRGQNIYIALETDYDFFKHDIDVPINKKTVIKGHLDELQSLMAIIDDLNLNKRIWSKIPLKLDREDNRNNG